MTDLALLAVCLLFAATGFLTPFVWSLGYVWVDTLVPHRLSYSLLSNVPIAFIMGAAAFSAYLIQDRRSPPRISMVHLLCFVMAGWITLTTTWAVAPDQAWTKWDVAVKTVLFTAFMPFVFRTRVQIEAFLMVLTLAAAGHLIPWGLKTMLTGGGYRQSLGLMSVNSTMLAESSAVAAVTALFVPLLLWFRTHSLLVPWMKVRTWIASVLIVLYLLANIGTFARTGLIALGILGGTMLLRTKRKLLFLLLAAMMGGVLFAATSDKWTERVSTISDYENEGSAYTRILIWKWTLGFVVEHPLGGGFNCYVINVIVNPPGPDGKSTVQFGRAFHNIYFAALGEHGWIGLGIYGGILVLSLLNMQRLIRACRGRPDLLWAADLARAAQLGLAILMACGNFIDISFNFIIWDMVALMMCLHAHVQHVLNPRLTTEEKQEARRRQLLSGGRGEELEGAGAAAARPGMARLR